ncbi:ABC transporter permease subunit [Microbacterium sp. NPDC055683]
MDELLRFALLGIGVGAVYGLTAQGLVLIFLGSRVINFSQGSIALVAAYAYVESASAGIPAWLAAILAVIAATGCGALIELLIMRRMRDASSITRLVATIAVLTVVQSAAALIYGDTTQFAPSLLPTSVIDLGGGLVIGADRLVVLGAGIGVTILLAVLMTRTRWGLATLGTAENPFAVEVLGWPARSLSLANWMLGALLAGIAGVLVAPMNGVSVAGMGQIVYCALAAALIGGFRSFGWAMTGGLILGIAQSEAVLIRGEVGWSTAIPFIIIVVAVLVRGDVVRGRGGVRQRLSAVGSGRISLKAAIGSAAIAGVLSLLLGHAALDALSTSLIVAVLALSVVVATGYAGELSLAQYAVAGTGALAAALVADSAGMPFLVSLPIGALAGTACGSVIGLLSLRVRGDVVAIITVGLALAIQALILENPLITGGISGIAVPAPTVFGIAIDAVDHPERFTIFCALVLVVVAVVVANLRRGAAGRRLLAMRSGERAAASLGVSATGARLYALAVAGGIAGTAGALLAFRQPRLVFDAFTVDASLALLGAVVLGGVGYIAAGIVGGFTVTGGLVYHLMAGSGWQQWLPLLLGLALLVNLVFVPDGVIPANGRWLAAMRRRPRSDPARARMDQGDPGEAVATARGRSLVVDSVTVAFGGVRALDDVSLRLDPGRVTGLIGPNGAGKTTLIDSVTGMTRTYTGAVHLAGTPIDGLSAARRSRAGLGRTLQGLELFEELTVRENLQVASDPHVARRYLTDLVRPGRAVLSAGAWTAIRRFDLVDDLDHRPGQLPYGRRRLVAIARSIAAQPDVLLMDEPAAGLSSLEREELGDLIQEMAKEWKMAILLVEHDVDLVMRVCDEITVLDGGRVIAQGTPESVRAHRDVRRAFLGEEMVS